MMVELDTLLDELARRHARGEPLDVEGTLARAGDRADELAPLIEAFLARAPRREPTAESLAFVRSLDEPPLLRARVAKSLKVDDVVDVIVADMRARPRGPPEGAPLLPAARGRDARPDPRRRDGLGRDHAGHGSLARALSAPSGPAAAAPMYRADALVVLDEQLVPRAAPEPSQPDMVDALFLGEPAD